MVESDEFKGKAPTGWNGSAKTNLEEEAMVMPAVLPTVAPVAKVYTNSNLDEIALTLRGGAILTLAFTPEKPALPSKVSPASTTPLPLLSL